MPSGATQSGQNPLFGSVPTGQPTPGVMPLGALDAIDRGLKYNLSLILSEQATTAARGARYRALAEVLPTLNGRVGESIQVINLAAFGIPAPAKDTYDGRLKIEQSLFDPTINARGGSSTRVFEAWADQLRAAGIRRIEGRIVANASAFDPATLGAGWAWDYLAYGYAAGVSALQYNEDNAAITIRPLHAFRPALMAAAYPRFDSAAMTRSASGC